MFNTPLSVLKKNVVRDLAEGLIPCGRLLTSIWLVSPCGLEHKGFCHLGALWTVAHNKRERTHNKRELRTQGLPPSFEETPEPPRTHVGGRPRRIERSPPVAHLPTVKLLSFFSQLKFSSLLIRPPLPGGRWAMAWLRLPWHVFSPGATVSALRHQLGSI